MPQRCGLAHSPIQWSRSPEPTAKHRSRISSVKSGWPLATVPSTSAPQGLKDRGKRQAPTPPRNPSPCTGCSLLPPPQVLPMPRWRHRHTVLTNAVWTASGSKRQVLQISPKTIWIIITRSRRILPPKPGYLTACYPMMACRSSTWTIRAAQTLPPLPTRVASGLFLSATARAMICACLASALMPPGRICAFHGGIRPISCACL